MWEEWKDDTSAALTRGSNSTFIGVRIVKRTNPVFSKLHCRWRHIPSRFVCVCVCECTAIFRVETRWIHMWWGATGYDYLQLKSSVCTLPLYLRRHASVCTCVSASIRISALRESIFLALTMMPLTLFCIPKWFWFNMHLVWGTNLKDQQWIYDQLEIVTMSTGDVCVRECARAHTHRTWMIEWFRSTDIQTGLSKTKTCHDWPLASKTCQSKAWVSKGRSEHSYYITERNWGISVWRRGSERKSHLSCPPWKRAWVAWVQTVPATCGDRKHGSEREAHFLIRQPLLFLLALQNVPWHDMVQGQSIKI